MSSGLAGIFGEAGNLRTKGLRRRGVRRLGQDRRLRKVMPQFYHSCRGEQGWFFQFVTHPHLSHLKNSLLWIDSGNPHFRHWASEGWKRWVMAILLSRLFFMVVSYSRRRASVVLLTCGLLRRAIAEYGAFPGGVS